MLESKSINYKRMITQEQLEEIGFKKVGLFYHLDKDRGHVIPGHDSLKIFLHLDHPFITIVIEHQSSWTSTKEQVFKGFCEDIEFFKSILKSCCKYYGVNEII